MKQPFLKHLLCVFLLVPSLGFAHGFKSNYILNDYKAALGKALGVKVEVGFKSGIVKENIHYVDGSVNDVKAKFQILYTQEGSNEAVYTLIGAQVSPETHNDWKKWERVLAKKAGMVQPQVLGAVKLAQITKNVERWQLWVKAENQEAQMLQWEGRGIESSNPAAFLYDEQGFREMSRHLALGATIERASALEAPQKEISVLEAYVKSRGIDNAGVSLPAADATAVAYDSATEVQTLVPALFAKHQVYVTMNKESGMIQVVLVD